MKIRSISILLMFAMLFSIIACAEKTDIAVSGGTATAADTTAEEIDYESLSLLERLQLDYNSVPDDLPDANYEDYTFRIHTSQNVATVIGDPDNVSEVVGEAVYARRIEVEDRFNVKFEEHTVANEGDYSKYVSLMNSLFMAGDDAFDLMIVWNTTASTFVKQGYLANMSDIAALDFSKPWFYKDAIDMLSYKGHVFCTVDLLQAIYSSLSCSIFNKDMAADYNLENLYDVVRRGDWTLDYLIGVTKDTWVDVNGNGQIDRDNDDFGIAIPIATFTFTGMPAFGANIIGKDADDIPYLAASENAEHINNVFTKLRDYVKGDSVTTDDWLTTPFSEGRSLFVIETVGLVSTLRDTDFEYGILPLFKYDDTAENYRSAFLPYPSAIPSTCSDPERSGVILSAMAAGGYKKVSVAYFETAVKTKYTTDEDSAEMLDIIAGNVTSDGTIMFTDALIYTFLEFVKSNKEFASFWAAKEKAAQTYLENMNTAIEKYIG